MTAIEHANSPSVKTLAGKYLTFRLQEESYGVDVLQVREIIRLAEITSIPQMPSYVKGVINLRGKIIPVIDLRLRLGFPQAPPTEQTCIIVTELKAKSGKKNQIGMIVDQVEEVVNFGSQDIEETPDFGSQQGASYIVGMAKVKGAVKSLLNIGEVLQGEVLEKMTGQLVQSKDVSG